MDPCY